MEDTDGRTFHQYGNVVVDAGTATVVELEVLADAYLKDEKGPTTA